MRMTSWIGEMISAGLFHWHGVAAPIWFNPYLSDRMPECIYLVCYFFCRNDTTFSQDYWMLVGWNWGFLIDGVHFLLNHLTSWEKNLKIATAENRRWTRFGYSRAIPRFTEQNNNMISRSPYILQGSFQFQFFISMNLTIILRSPWNYTISNLTKRFFLDSFIYPSNQPTTVYYGWIILIHDKSCDPQRLWALTPSKSPHKHSLKCDHSRRPHKESWCAWMAWATRLAAQTQNSSCVVHGDVRLAIFWKKWDCHTERWKNSLSKQNTDRSGKRHKSSKCSSFEIYQKDAY